MTPFFEQHYRMKKILISRRNYHHIFWNYLLLKSTTLSLHTYDSCLFYPRLPYCIQIYTIVFLTHDPYQPKCIIVHTLERNIDYFGSCRWYQNSLNFINPRLKICFNMSEEASFHSGLPSYHIAHPTGYGVKKVIYSDHINSCIHFCRKKWGIFLLGM